MEKEIAVEVPMIDGEDGSERFQRLATYRFEKTVKRIRQIAHLANKNTYVYKLEEVERMFSLLHDELDNAQMVFTGVEDIPKLF